eukprot:g819.t1
MASIDKLSIRGIRSFSPQREEVVDLYKPLTVIFGRNGCGKTTIIECLKYACSGTLPPGGSKSGQYFIHDPKIADETEVKGQIKMRFMNRAGRKVDVIRSMQVTQKKKTMTFRALDSTVVTYHRGEKRSVTQRCAEVDKLIPHLLGVKQAVLDNVIFCHQEESNWPLWEGSKIKEKFDKIFESTRYTLALKKILEVKKQNREKQKDQVRDLSIIEERVSTSETIKRQRDECRRKRGDIETKVTKLREAKEIDERKLEETNETLAAVQRLHARRESVEADLRRLESELCSAKEERRKTDEPDGFEASVDELEIQLKNVTETDKSRELKDAKEGMNELRRKLAELAGDESDLIESKGRLRGKIEAMNLLADDVYKRMRELERKYEKIRRDSPSRREDGGDGDSPEEIVRSGREFAKDLKRLQREKTTRANAAEAAYKREMDDMTRKLDSLNEEIIELKSAKGTRTAEVKSCEDKRRETEAELKRRRKKVNDSDKRLRVLNDRIELETKKSKAEEEGIRAFDKDVQNRDRDLATIDFDIKRLETERESLISRGDFDRKVREIEKRVQSLEDTQRSIENRLKDAGLETIVGHPLDASSADEDVREALRKRKDVERDAREDTEEVKRQIAVAKSRRKEAVQHLTESENMQRKCERDLRQFRAFLANEDGLEKSTNTSPTSALDHLKSRETHLNKEHFMIENIGDVCAWIEERGRKDHCCPVCTRRMNDDQESRMIRALTKMAEDAKDETRLGELQAELKRLEDARSLIEASIPAWSRAERLEKELIPDAKTKLDAVEIDIDRLETDFEKSQGVLDAASVSVREIEVLQDDVNGLCNVWEQLSATKLELVSEQRVSLGVTADAGERTLSHVEKDLKATRGRRAEIEGAKEGARASQQRTRDAYLKRKLCILELQKEKDDVSNAVSGFKSLQTQESELASKIETLEREAREADGDLASVKRTLQERKGSIDRKKRSREATAKTTQSELQELRQDEHVFTEKHRELDTALKGGASRSNVEDLESRIAEAASRKAAVEVQMKSLEPYLTQLEDGASRAKLVAVAINADIRVRKAEKKMSDTKVRLGKIREEIETHLHTDDAEDVLVERLERLQDSLRRRLVKISEAGGRVKQLREQEREHDVELQKYKDIEEKHRRKKIDVHTAQMVVDDLGKYHTALDQALMEYHDNAIRKINVIIAQLWSLTYKGGDIEKIEIHSTTSGRGKTFTYKIVMLKGDMPIEMKGRCSAGQKVLASLVIRLALADVFGANCGVLTLDEPTTNLDEPNKRGLAEALSKIIEERRQQTNFQLVVITHDKTFVELLGESQANLGGRTTKPEFKIVVDRACTDDEDGEDEGNGGQYGGRTYYSTIKRLPYDDA